MPSPVEAAIRGVVTKGLMGVASFNRAHRKTKAPNPYLTSAHTPLKEERTLTDLKVTGSDTNVNQTLEKAGRVDDFFELGMLMCKDALNREERCGGHFRSEHQTDEGEALRNDDDYAYVSAWEWSGDMANPIEHKEQLEYEVVKFQTRSYK